MNHSGAWMLTVCIFVPTYKIAPKWAAPEASVYTTTGLDGVVITHRGRLVPTLAIRRGITSRNPTDNFVGEVARAEYCRSENGWRGARPIRPNRSVWAKPRRPRILAASADPNAPRESSSFKSDAVATRFSPGNDAATYHVKNSTVAHKSSIGEFIARSFHGSKINPKMAHSSSTTSNADCTAEAGSAAKQSSAKVARVTPSNLANEKRTNAATRPQFAGDLRDPDGWVRRCAITGSPVGGAKITVANSP